MLINIKEVKLVIEKDTNFNSLSVLANSLLEVIISREIYSKLIRNNKKLYDEEIAVDLVEIILKHGIEKERFIEIYNELLEKGFIKEVLPSPDAHI